MYVLIDKENSKEFFNELRKNKSDLSLGTINFLENYVYKNNEDKIFFISTESLMWGNSEDLKKYNYYLITIKKYLNRRSLWKKLFLKKV